ARAERLRTIDGVARWRVTGHVRNTGCTGRVRVELRGVKTITTRLERCRFNVVVRSRRSSSRIVVRTVPTTTLAPARSREARA
ncbi:MAG TPA: hypothetical protein VI072_31335, partial [Polyangiaceae bacterium]